jgi:peptide-methionine (S)-S-oxide reductase
MKIQLLLTILVTGSVLVATLVISVYSGYAESTEASGRSRATFAGGCFWCMQPPFDRLEGVISTTVGYTGGHKANPTYEEVSTGGTGHAEALQVIYDPGKISYSELLDVFWHNIDPYDAEGQFCDRGNQYRAAIFTHSQEQKTLAERSKEKLELVFDQPIATEIVPAGPFYHGEEYHQDYYRKNPLRYKLYRYGCGRDNRLRQIWKGK